MGKLFDRFRKANSPPREKQSRLIDQPLIGSELFEGRPVSAREYLMPLRQKIQAEYRSEGRDPDSLSKVPADQRDEMFWMAYVDSLLVFERDDEALIWVSDLIKRYPSNDGFKELKGLIEARMRNG